MKKYLFLLSFIVILPIFGMERTKEESSISVQQKLEEAIKTDNLGLCRILLEELGANPDALNSDGLSPLHIALQSKTLFETHNTNHEIVKLLLMHGARPKTRIGQVKLTFGLRVTKSLGKELNTALHIAAQNECQECCDALISFLINHYTPEEKQAIEECLAQVEEDKELARQELDQFLLKEKIKTQLIPLLKTLNNEGITPYDYFKYTQLHPKAWENAIKESVKKK